MSQLKNRGAFCAGAIVLSLAGAAWAGPDWIEGGEDTNEFLPDAGSLPDTAQPVGGEGPVTSIRGRLRGTAGATEGGSGDFEDMYLVVIDSFADFFFSSESNFDAIEGGEFPFACTSLFLFTGPDHPAGEGLGIFGNIDTKFGCGAALDNHATDESPTPELIDGLSYYICFAGDGRFPVDANGDPIFEFFSVEGGFGEVSGPDGLGGANPIAGWQGVGSFGDYFTFIVEGVSPAPVQAPTGDCQISFEPAEFNDECVGPFGNQTIEILEDCTLITGKLETRLIQGAQPDTWLCVFDKFGNTVASNDNGSMLGNGKGSGVWSVDGPDADSMADILQANGDGTYSLRLGVTGFPDGFDGNCNGLFQNAPHGQIGEFTLYVTYLNAMGVEIRQDTYVDEFITGAECFKLNFTAPAGSAEVHVEIDNTTGREELNYDVDFMCFSGLEPLGSYCITVVGGLDADCNPTNTQLCWLDKNCDVIGADDDGGPAAGYSELCVIADVNGNICISVSGGGDDDCDGWILGEAHGVEGTYTLKVALNPDANQPSEPVNPHPGGTDDCVEAAMATQGDVNMDGIVDGGDLAKLLSNWGLVTAN